MSEPNDALTRAQEEAARARREFEEFMAAPIPLPRPRPMAILAEVSGKMHKAVKARPQDLKLVAKDEHDNVIIERPFRPRREERIAVDGPHSAVGEMRWGREGEPWGNGIPTPSWNAGGGRGDELVKRNYNIFAVLREDD
jgi:hypothetical protein